MKKILILGGTGAMGKALVNLLDKTKFEIYVTSRKVHKDDNIFYIQGNAHDTTFLDSVLARCDWDSIIDFMNYQESEFKNIVSRVLKRTKQYIFISSARVYAPTELLISEQSPRLLDICEDKDYISTNEYAIAKAKEENLLLNSGYNNWTIIRPSLTYNDNRLQLALWEKEEWLYRALSGRSIIFPKTLANVKTTMSYGYDVSVALSKLISNEKAIGEIINIAGAEALSWSEILQIYVKAIKEKTGKEVKIYYADDWQDISKQCNKFYQAKYARTINREFTSDKLIDLIGQVEFVSPEVGLRECIHRFIDHGSNFSNINWRIEAVCDRVAGETIDLKEFSSFKQKLAYLIKRYIPFLMKIIE